jgi:hypothetical protein
MVNGHYPRPPLRTLFLITPGCAPLVARAAPADFDPAMSEQVCEPVGVAFVAVPLLDITRTRV